MNFLSLSFISDPELPGSGSEMIFQGSDPDPTRYGFGSTIH